MHAHTHTHTHTHTHAHTRTHTYMYILYSPKFLWAINFAFPIKPTDCETFICKNNCHVRNM